jgi:hypothetical protein
MGGALEYQHVHVVFHYSARLLHHANIAGHNNTQNIRLLLSLLCWLKVILLSGGHCIVRNSVQPAMRTIPPDPLALSSVPIVSLHTA